MKLKPEAIVPIVTGDVIKANDFALRTYAELRDNKDVIKKEYEQSNSMWTDDYKELATNIETVITNLRACQQILENKP